MELEIKDHKGRNEYAGGCDQSGFGGRGGLCGPITFSFSKFLLLYLLAAFVPISGCSNLDREDHLVITAESCEKFMIEYREATEGYEVQGPPIPPTL